MTRRAPERPKATLVERAEAKAAVKAAVSDEMHARKLVPADLGAQVGVSEQEMTRKLSSKDGMKHVTLADLVLLDEDLISGVLTRLLADRGLGVVQIPPPVNMKAVSLDVVEHHEAATTAVHSHLLAVADRKITRIEGADLEEKVLHELRVCAVVLGAARRAQRLGVLDVDVPGAH